jgi:hypothetical protein
VWTFPGGMSLQSMKDTCLSKCIDFVSVPQGSSTGCCAVETAGSGSCWASTGAPQDFWSQTVVARSLSVNCYVASNGYRRCDTH